MKSKQKKAINTAKTTFAAKDDVVRVIKFSVTPVKPRPGEEVAIKMTIKNSSGKTLKRVPWQIILGKKLLYSGTRYGLKAKDTFSVKATWTAVAGSHFIFADADPDNTLDEPRIMQFNNLPQGFDVVVAKK
jgi:hypothetical protein